jgi:hypothetical protein
MRGISVMRMGGSRSLAALAAAITLSFGLAGCGTVDDALFGSPEPAADEAAPSPSGPSALPGTMGGTNEGTMAGTQGVGTSGGITPIAIEPGSDTGTVVSKTVASLRAELSGMQDRIVSAANNYEQLQGAAVQFSGSYHQDKAQITTRLQMGTTRGNPELVSQWNQAQSSLDSLTGNVNQLSALGTEITDIDSRAHYILNTIQATYDVSGAVDEDHRQLSVLEDETNQTIVLIDRLLKDVSDTIQRQTAYVANERANLATLASSIKNGELYGGNLGMGMAVGGPAPAYQMAESGAALVTIRFDHANVDFQQILYTALSQALQSRPNATFSVVGVSPTRGTAAAVQLAQTSAQRHAQEVLRSMTDMGVPGARLGISSATDPSISAVEVRVYVH